MGRDGHEVALVVKSPTKPDVDFRTTVLLPMSVRELKVRLCEAHPSTPMVDRQTLIFAGRVLHDGDDLEPHLAMHDMTAPITLHLVIAQPWPTPVLEPPPPLPPQPTQGDAAPAASAASGGEAQPWTAPPSSGGFVCSGVQYAVYEWGGQPYVLAIPQLQPFWIATGTAVPPGAWLATSPYPAHAVLTGGHPWAQPHAQPGVRPPPPPLPHDWTPEQAAAYQWAAAANAPPQPQPWAADGRAPGPRLPETPVAPVPPAAPAAPAAPAVAPDDAQAAQRDAVQLAVKLVLLVLMLGQDGDLGRLALLCAAALAIFLAQTQNVAQLLPALRARAIGDPPPAAAQGPRAAAPASTLELCVSCAVAFVASLFPGYQLQRALPPLGAEHVPLDAQQPAPEAPGGMDGMPNAEPAPDLRMDARARDE